MQTFAFILILVVAVIASLPIARITRVLPLPIVQIAIGALLAWPVTGGVHVELEPEVFLLIFIPPLLFGDAWQAPKREFWKMRVSIASMAFGLVFFTIATFGYALHWLVPAVPLSVAFAAAAVLSPTDAVAVSSIIDEEKLPPNLLHLLAGESLLNDASGLVMFRFAVAAALTGSFSFAEASVAFIYAVVGGAAAGLVCLWIVAKATKILARLDAGAAEAQVLVLVILPFLAYLLAEHLHASGVLAAVVAGMYAGRWGLFRHLGVSARMLSVSTWQMIGFALNGAIFVFLGLQLPAIIRAVPPELTNWHWFLQPVLVVVALTLCLMALRYLFMLAGGLFGRITMRMRGQPHYLFNTRLKVITSIAGVRGAVTLAGVLSLPVAMPDGAAFPARDMVIFLGTGVILCWLAIAALTLPGLTRGLVHDGHEAAALELRRARIAAAEAAIAKLEGFTGSEKISARQAVAEGMIASYRRRISALQEGETPAEETKAEFEAHEELRKLATDTEADTVRDMMRSGDINDHTAQRLFRELTLSQAVLASKGQGAA